MIRILVVYPRSEGSTFDLDYYRSTHMPLVKEKWPSVVRTEVDLGGPDQPHHCIGHVVFPSVDAMAAAMSGPGAAVVMGDIANFTNVQPQVFMSEVVEGS
jgi:uncharacterized protein (TIGR02118 family)